MVCLNESPYGVMELGGAFPYRGINPCLLNESPYGASPITYNL